MSPSSAPAPAPKWEFKARFRRNAFGWKSQPAIQRIREAVSEIRKVARRDPVLATFRPAAKKYPHKDPAEILADLVKTTPGQQGKWFATARQLGLYDTAATLAWASACDPRTLTRAARDHAGDRPAFAVEAGCAALHWLAQGFGYEITRTDVQAAGSATLAAAESLDRVEETRERMRALAGDPQGFVRQALARELGPAG